MPTNSSTVSDTDVVSPSNVGGGNAMIEVANKMFEAKNVLVALSSDPSVDEMAAAIGLTLYLDRLGKRATAIYSGATPNALEFLEPEKAFESTADSLQDFVIALNKDKADHLRYKLDGEYVKIYITPYKTRIDSRDLEFSYGDYNVDLVLALDVMNGADLDSALREHGRIMHDAVVINITTGNPGKFGEIEWSDKRASSISEMVAKLLYSVSGAANIEKDDATAFLTGIVAATNRFSNAKTTPDTMQIASRLMESGANQQLVSKNITPDVENELYETKEKNSEEASEDPTKFKIAHEIVGVERPDGADKEEDVVAEAKIEKNSAELKDNSGNDVAVAEAMSKDALVEDLKEAAADLTQAGNEVVPEAVEQPVKIETGGVTATAVESELNANFGSGVTPNLAPISNETGVLSNSDIQGSPSLPPVAPLSNEMSVNTITNTAGTQLPGANLANEMAASNTVEPVLPAVEGAAATIPGATPIDAVANGANPASMMAPQVASTPETNGVPEMNYMPLPGQEILPPPPTPPLDINGSSIGSAGADVPVMPPESAATYQTEPSSASATTAALENVATPNESGQPASLGQQPAMQDQVYVPQAVDPGAFKIPGM